MDWIVKNALNRDVERQHLNKILAEIRKTVDSISLSNSYDSVEEAVGRMVEGNREAGINVTYDPVRKVLDFAIVPFTLRLEGDVSGTATVNSLGTMVLNTTIDPAARGVEEAPQDGTPYWRQDGSWYNVPNAIFRLAEVDDPGLLTMDTYGNIYGVEIEGTVNEVDVENGDGVEGPPVISLSDLENTGEGLSPVKIYTRDSKGRIVGDEDASTDDLPEGEGNLYFTVNRAIDAVGLSLVDTAEIVFTYDGTVFDISAHLTEDVRDRINSAIQEVVPGANISVDSTTPTEPVISLAPLDSLQEAADDTEADLAGVEIGSLYRNGSVLMVRVT